MVELDPEHSRRIGEGWKVMMVDVDPMAQILTVTQIDIVLPDHLRVAQEEVDVTKGTIHRVGVQLRDFQTLHQDHRPDSEAAQLVEQVFADENCSRMLAPQIRAIRATKNEIETVWKYMNYKTTSFFN